MLSTLDEDAPSAITLEEFRRAQSFDRWRQAIRKNLNEECSQYEEHEHIVLVPIPKLDSTAQDLVPKPLRQRLLHLAHHTRLAGHPGITHMFYTLRRNFFWPSLLADIRVVLQHCY